tara:strand:- start:21306 stop:21764 length:459 start_codon:yes stop_codon:yes gene_type:complete
MKFTKYHTSRCILKADNTFLLVVHNNFRGVNNGIWGLPGGRIDPGENPLQTVRREIYEELDTGLDELHEVGDWSYKGSLHKIFGTVFKGEIGRVDHSEILATDWFTLDDIRGLAEEDRLHAGFELKSIERFTGLLDELGPYRRRLSGSKRFS